MIYGHDTQAQPRCRPLKLVDIGPIAMTETIDCQAIKPSPLPKPQPKPQPEIRLSVYCRKTGQVFVRDVPIVREEEFGKDRYYFVFKDGSGKYMDLSGMDYRIIRREV